MKSALKQIPSKIEELIENHRKDLEEARANCGDSESLVISFPVKIGIDKNSKRVCDVGIQFIKERVKDSITFSWDDSQLSLLKNLRDVCPKGEGESVTISTPGKEPIVLTKGTRDKIDRVMEK